MDAGRGFRLVAGAYRTGNRRIPRLSGAECCRPRTVPDKEPHIALSGVALVVYLNHSGVVDKVDRREVLMWAEQKQKGANRL